MEGITTIQKVYKKKMKRFKRKPSITELVIYTNSLFESILKAKKELKKENLLTHKQVFGYKQKVYNCKQ